MAKNAGLLPGTLDMLILKAVSLKPLHGYGVLLRIQQISNEALRRAARLAVSRALSPRAPGADRRRMGRERKQAQGQVLHGDRDRPSPSQGRNGGMEPARDPPCGAALKATSDEV